MNPGEWVWVSEQQQLCRIVEVQSLWGQTLYRVWLPTQDTIVRIAADKLQPLTEAGLTSPAEIAYIAAAARVADALTKDVLLAVHISLTFANI